jgi:hypothetical protein
MERHRENPSCHGCHGVMDPLGFALENFDAVGRWRSRDRFIGTVIDSRGELPDGTELHGPQELVDALLSRPDQFVQTMTEKLMMFALGRVLGPRDMPQIRAIVRAAAEEDYRFSALVLGIANSPQFRQKASPRLEAGEKVAAAQ